MLTSDFRRVKQIEAAGLTPVAISRGIPRWFHGRRELRLAPARNMLWVPPVEFDAYYNRLLLGLDPEQLFQDLGDDAVLLCWEQPGEGCHRRSVAEWFEYHLGVVVPEFGYDRLATGWQEHARYHFSEPEPVKRRKMALMIEGEVPPDDNEPQPDQPRN